MRLPSEIDISNAGAVGEDLQAVLRQGALSVFVDMSGTVFCDCAGVAALIGAHLLALQREAEFRLVADAPAVRRIFELTGAHRLFDIHPSLPSAFAYEPGLPAVSPLLEGVSAVGQDPPAQVPPATTPSLLDALRRPRPAAAAAVRR